MWTNENSYGDSFFTQLPEQITVIESLENVSNFLHEVYFVPSMQSQPYTAGCIEGAWSIVN